MLFFFKSAFIPVFVTKHWANNLFDHSVWVIQTCFKWSSFEGVVGETLQND